MNNQSTRWRILGILLLGFWFTGVSAYGGGGGQADKCKKPSFMDMSPPQSSVVPPGSEFSFVASSNTNPKSLKVSVKGHDVDLRIEKNGRIKVTGNLPPEITEGYARINISGSSSAKCSVQDGWLLKIGD